VFDPTLRTLCQSTENPELSSEKLRPLSWLLKMQLFEKNIVITNFYFIFLSSKNFSTGLAGKLCQELATLTCS
jgi:hypothetical protein